MVTIDTRNLPRHKRSVQRDLQRFSGYGQLLVWREKIKECYRQPDGLLMPCKDQSRTPLLKQVFNATFALGTRISETLWLTRENFSWDDKWLTCSLVPIFKHYEKTGEWWQVSNTPTPFTDGTGQYVKRRYETKPILVFRSDFVVPVTEPITKDFVNFLKLIPLVKDNIQYLFNVFSRQQIFYSFRYADERLFPHRLRGERASCLASVFSFPLERISEFFGWESPVTALRYSRMGVQSKKFFEQAPSDVFEKNM